MPLPDRKAAAPDQPSPSGRRRHRRQRPSSPLRIALRNFTSQWFLLPQGTGILAVILHQLDYQFHGLYIISYTLWILSIVLLSSFLCLYAARLALFRDHVLHALRYENSEIDCLASVSIAFTSVLQMAAIVLTDGWGKGWGLAAYSLWWFNLALAVCAAVGIPFVYMRVYPLGIAKLSPPAQLPLIATLTAAAGCGTMCQYAQVSPQLQVPAIIVSYLLVGSSLPLALSLDNLFWTRLLEGSFPAPKMTYQDMILCGPWGQGSFALQGLGQAVIKGAFSGYASGVFISSQAAPVVGYGSMFAGLLSWGFATFWWLFAIGSLIHAATDQWRPQKLGYGLVTWSLVFPWGVYTNAAVMLGKLMDSTAFRVWSTVLTIALVTIWLCNVFFTVKGVIDGSLLGLEHGWNKAAYGAEAEAVENEEVEH